jgi:uncharacterized protein YjiK
MNKLLIGLLVVAAAGLCVFFFWPDIQAVFGTSKVAAATYSNEEDEKKGDKKKKDKDKKEEITDSPVKVLQRWELPPELVEISGIAFTGSDEVASVQDEEGRIYIYNLESRKLTRQVPFAGPGDYEGIAVVGPAAWVIRADGVLYEVQDYRENKAKTTKHVTGLTQEQDVEGLTYDKKNNRLLMAIKGKEAGGADYKGIYAFNLKTKKMEKTPAYRLQLSDPVFSNAGGKKKEDVIQPSDLVVHPSSGELYVLEGAKPKMLILDASGKPRHLYKMKSSDFPQPEGIDFNEAGDLFISNEGGKGQGTIVKVSLPNS